MLKVAWLVRLSQQADREEALHAWNEEHARLIDAVPGVERVTYNQTVAVAEGPGAWTEQPRIDGIVCTWWTDEVALEEGLGSPQWQRVLEHARSIFDPDTGFPNTPGIQVEERIMRIGPGTPWSGADVPTPLCKHIGVLFFRPDITRAAASAHWTNVHGALALEIPEIRYYVQNHGVRPVKLDGSDGDHEFPFDGFSEAWFTDRETFERSHETPAWYRLRDDSPNLFDVDALESGVNCVVDERVIKE
jgi:uncharacterized protein (TIGR02118 family)